MISWNSEEISRALGADVPPGLVFSSISTDTRTLRKGALFVALSGENFDGHAFLEDAVRLGASAAIVMKGSPPCGGLPLVEVIDTHRAYRDLATHFRSGFFGPVVAITGSNGKTSTKEMVAAVLGARLRVHATRANDNNTVGVPKTILEAPEDAETIVVEVGASEPGEIAMLRDIVRPDIGIVTNVFAAHLQGFGTIDDVLSEKAELLRGVERAFVGTEPPELKECAMALAAETFSVGLGEADVRPDRIKWEGAFARLYVNGSEFVVPVPGVHQAANAVFALAVGRFLDVEIEAACRALEAVEIPAGRSEIVRVGDMTVLNDCYNSNPASLSAALDTVSRMRGDSNLVLVIGSMLELGELSDAEHARMLDRALAVRPAAIVAVGGFADAAREKGIEGDLILAEDSEQAGRLLVDLLRGDDLILLKGSRGVRLEKVLEYLKRESR